MRTSLMGHHVGPAATELTWNWVNKVPALAQGGVKLTMVPLKVLCVQASPGTVLTMHILTQEVWGGA